MQLTEHFTLEELIYSSTAKAKGLKNEPTQDHIENLKLLCEYVLEPIREKIGCPLVISSGYRSEKVNAIVGGSKTSQHILGQAADIQIFDKAKTNKDLFDIIEEMVKNNELQVGQVIWEFGETEPNWVHVSLPTSRHRNEIMRASQVYDKHISKFKTVYTRIS